jgi:thiamine biosynthesis protein ThiI
MLRIAQRIAQKNNIQVMATGESIGQVGSQTIENITTIRNVVTMPILSPLIGMDKQDIVNKARLLETYSISIIPDQDCCTLFAPRHPRTRSTSEELDNIESALDTNAIVEETINATEVLHLAGIASSSGINT